MKGAKNINLLFEYQKFSPNSSLGKKIDEVNARYFISNGVELDDNILDVSAAGEPNSLSNSLPNSLTKLNGGGSSLDASRSESGDIIHSLS